MSDVIHTEHGITTTIKEYNSIGPELKGMRSDKPFFKEGKLMINTGGKLCLVTKVTITDNEGKVITMDKAPLDTDTRIGGVILRGEEILLLHRVKNSREYYVFPGGHKSRFESDIETLEREIKEELGLTIDSEKVKLILETNEQGFGKEKFFLIEGISDFSNLRDENPDIVEGEVNEPIFLKLEDAKDMDNIFPKELILSLKY